MSLLTRIFRAPNFQALACLAAMSSCGAAFAQLPPTNMGKFVHTPGDNQYTDQTQLQRHPVYQPPPQPQGGGRMQLMRAPAGPKIDVSIEPISCDEPIAPALFPPFPDRLDLPISSSTGGSWLKEKSEGGGGNSAGSVTYHQSYGHVPMGQRPDSIYRMAQPIPVGGGAVPGLTQQGSAPMATGSFMDPGGDTTGGMGMNNGAQGAPQGYKVRTDAAGGGSYQRAPVGTGGGTANYYQRIPVGASGGTTNQYQRAPLGSDTYGQPAGNSQYGDRPAYTGAGEREMRALGNEPRLNSGSGQQSPGAPSPVVVTQSSTQDLSLPEDDVNYKYRPASKSSNMGKNFGKLMKGPMNMMPMGF